MAGGTDGAVEALKARAGELVREAGEELVALSHAVHGRPELAFEERFASAALADALADRGIAVERGAHGLETAFVARAGERGPTVAVCCEYDALPGIGHGCGHNVIAAAGLGAGLALAALAEEAGGRVVVVGTPAEEKGGGKILLLRRGAFEGVDAAMMVHPAGIDALAPTMLAMAQLDVRAHGRPAHAAAFPWKGVNALDAVVLGYVGVAALRQHIRPTERVHGVITRGGDVPNVVPELAAARYNVRAETLDRLDDLKRRVLACAEAGATAAGATLEHRFLDPYADLVSHRPLLEAYAANAAALGRDVRWPEDVSRPAFGSTDMGNVSQAVPSIHPMVAVAPPHVALHTAEFAEHAVSEEADRAVVEAAIALARTAVDVWARPGLLAGEGAGGPRGDPG